LSYVMQLEPATCDVQSPPAAPFALPATKHAAQTDPGGARNEQSVVDHAEDEPRWVV